MNGVFYLSFTGTCRSVAKEIAEGLGRELFDLEKTGKIICDNAVVVFPVHCQGIPDILKGLAEKVQAERVALAAVYGSANPGNALFEAAKLFKKIYAAAYIPAGHAYNGVPADVKTPPGLIKAFARADGEIIIPKRRKTPLAGFLKGPRGRMIIKIRKSGLCDGCGACAKACPVAAMRDGKPASRCIRCLRCVYACPRGALTVKKSFILKAYLKKPRSDKFILYK